MAPKVKVGQRVKARYRSFIVRGKVTSVISEGSEGCEVRESNGAVRWLSSQIPFKFTVL